MKEEKPAKKGSTDLEWPNQLFLGQELFFVLEVDMNPGAYSVQKCQALVAIHEQPPDISERKD